MKIILAKITSALAIALCLACLITAVALAVIPAPTTLTINSIDAYQSTIATNDQLYIATFEIVPSGNMSTYGNAGQTFLFRLFNSGVEIAAATPYAFYNDGYSQGVIGFFFSASDASLPSWGTANVSLRLIGNPTLDWGSTIPSITYSTVDSWNSLNSGIMVGARVRTIALALENVWGVDLISPVNGVNKLTSTYGEDYFTSTIPNLQDIAPSLFTSSVTLPSFPSDNHSATGGNTSMDRWLTTGNSTFDVTPLVPTFGTSRNWIMSGLWIIASITMLVLMTYGVNESKRLGSMSTIGLRPSLYLFGFMLIVGSFMGFMVLQVGLFCGIFGGLIIVFAMFWRGSP